MTAEELRAWIKRRHLSHEEAAKELRLSIDGLRNNLYGRRPIGAQTERIIELSDRLDRVTSGPVITGSETPIFQR